MRPGRSRLTQLLMFPAARNDDMVDAVSQCSVYLQAGSGWESGWAGTLASRFAQLRKENPGTDPVELALKNGFCAGGPPYNLADAQMREQAKRADEPVFKRDRGSFGALKGLAMPSGRVTEPRRVPGPAVCPVCGDKGLARYEILHRAFVAGLARPATRPELLHQSGGQICRGTNFRSFDLREREGGDDGNNDGDGNE